MKIALNVIKSYKKGRSPETRHIIFVSMYHGCDGMVVGTGFIFPGFFNGFFLTATKEPIRTSGEEQQSQSRSRATIVEKGTAPIESSIIRKVFTKMKIPKAREGKKNAVTNAVFSH
jgi:hypothetical protein